MKRIRRVDINTLSILVRFAQRREPTVFTDEGKDVALLYPLRECDRESAVLWMNKRFIGMIERSRKRLDSEGGISSEDLRQHFGMKKKGHAAGVRRKGRTRIAKMR